MVSKQQPKLISEDSARAQWNQMIRKERHYILDKIRSKINRKDVGAASYYYGNLYPKTQQAIRRFLSGG